MTSGRPQPRISRLWQLPLLLFAVALFGYAVYLFTRSGPGPSVGQRLDAARQFIRQDRAEAAIAVLNGLLSSEKLSAPQEGAARLLLGEALELGARQKRLDVAEIHRRIIQQTEQALNSGIETDASVHRRLAESYQSLGRADVAIAHYRKAAALDPARALTWRRRIIDLQLERADPTAAAELEDFLRIEGLAEAERAWALGEKAHLLVDAGSFKEAQSLLAEAIRLSGEGSPELGRFTYWQGYCAWKLGQGEQAERFLRLARDQFKGQHSLDADAALILGRLHQDRADWPTARSFFESILRDHFDAPAAVPAILGRGICRLAAGEEEAGLADLSDVVRRVREKPSLPASLKDQTVDALRKGSSILTASGNCEGALELMAGEQELTAAPTDEFFARLGRLYERRANQLEATLSEAGADQREDLSRKLREHRTRAGDAFIACSRSLVLKDDKGYGLALWKGIEMYDAAANLPRVISALETFAAERPDDPLAPDACLRLGQAYHAAGLFDKAIASYKQCQFRYGKSLAASKAGVPLARAYLAKGPDAYPRAEETLRRVIENNPQITPEAQEFREALFELAQLYYRTARFEMSIARLEELVQRYPADDRMGQLVFLMADSYRKSAALLEERIASASAAAASPNSPPSDFDVQAARAAREQRLLHARGLYDCVIEHYRAGRPAERDLDRLYLKLSYFYRADCINDLGRYLEAIKLYDDAAFRYQDDPSALAAYVQIVNANVALGRIEEARAANERAKWMLRRMPPEVFQSGGLAMPKPAWEQWLKWSGESGLWK